LEEIRGILSISGENFTKRNFENEKGGEGKKE
jgi:hypothetical protein